MPSLFSFNYFFIFILDITQLTWELKKLNDTEMITAPVYKENSILISGLNNSVPEAHLLRYMKNKKRSGGGEIQSLTYLSEEEAVLTFVKETGNLDLNLLFISF